MESVIEACSYIIYEPGDVPGAPQHPFDLANRDFLTAESVSLPATGYLFLYRFAKSQGVLGEIMHRQREWGSLIRTVLVSIPVGCYRPQKADMASMSSHRMLRLPQRAKAAVLDDVGRHWETILAQHGRAQDGFPRRPTYNPDLLVELLETPPYNELRAIIVNLKTQAGGFVPFVFCPPGTREHYDRVFPGTEQPDLL